MAITHGFSAQSDARHSVVQHLQHLLGADRVERWDATDEVLQFQAAQAIAPEGLPACVLYPQTQEELAAAVAYAYEHQWSLMPVGHATKLHWGGVSPQVDVLISTARLNRLIDHAVGDLTVTAEAGMSFADLQAHLRDRHQQVGIDPAYGDRATLGGIVATANTGSWRQRYGGIRDMLIGISFVRPDGLLAKAGGQVVKNVAGYDLMKLMTGAYGTLGIMTQVTFRVYPIPPVSQTVLFAGSAEAIATLAERIFVSTLTPTQFDVLSPYLMQQLQLSPDKGQAMGLLVRFQSISVSVEQQVRQVQAIAHDVESTCGESGPNSSVLHTILIEPQAQLPLWRRLRETMESAPAKIPVTCKIGVEPCRGVEILDQLDALLPVRAIAQIHRGSGIGVLRLDGDSTVPQALLRLRQQCEAFGGYLTVLEAPPAWKRQIDVWGYPGNALPIMRQIKQQFDPEGRLSPNRFVGGL